MLGEPCGVTRFDAWGLQHDTLPEFLAAAATLEKATQLSVAWGFQVFLSQNLLNAEKGKDSRERIRALHHMRVEALEWTVQYPGPIRNPAA